MREEISADFPFEPNFVEVYDSKMHYVQEDHPHRIGREIADWLQTV